MKVRLTISRNGQVEHQSSVQTDDWQTWVSSEIHDFTRQEIEVMGLDNYINSLPILRNEDGEELELEEEETA